MSKKSLTFQILFYLFGMILSLLILVSSVHYYFSKQLISQDISSNTIHEIESSSLYISEYLETLKLTTNSIAKNKQVKDFAINNFKDENSIKDLLNTILNTNKNFVSVVLISKDGRIISNGSIDDMVTSSDMMSTKWYKEAINQGNIPILTASRMEASKWVVSISQEIVDDNKNNIGVIRLDIDYHSIESYLKRLQLGDNGYAFILNSKNELVYHPNVDILHSSEKMMSLVDISNSKSNSILGKNYFIHKSKIHNSDWLLVGVSSLNKIAVLTKQLLIVFISITSISFIICFIGITILVRKWLNPIYKLESIMTHIEKGNTQLRAEEIGSIEFQQLARHFNNMLENIESLMKEIKKQEKDIRDYELKALSSQINPHFLYNTLDAIIWMSEFKDNEKVIEITKALASYFRLALNNGKDLILLKDEINHVKQYLFIQKQRYLEKLDYEIYINGNIDDIEIPKLVLQPIVENAIYHGIKEVDRKGKIIIKVTRISNNISICIEDNGKGFSYSNLSNKKLGGIGIDNVRKRLELYFNGNFKMDIESKIDEYTKVYFNFKI